MADAMEQQLRDDQAKNIFGDNSHREGTKIFKTFEAAKISTTIGRQGNMHYCGNYGHE